MQLVIYVLLAFACLIGPPIGLGLLSPGPSETASWCVFVACAAIVVVFAPREARRDVDKLAGFATFFGVLWTLVYGTAAFTVDRPVGYAVVAAILGALTTVCLVRVVRSALWKDTLPNLRGLGWSPGALLEANGVQFAVVCEAAEHAWSSRVIRVDLQNCTDAPREVEFTFAPDSRAVRAVPVIGRAALGPLHVGTLRIELPADCPGGRFSIAPSVSGADGKRVRRWRARPYSPPVSRGFQAVALLTGTLVWGGGMSLIIPTAASAAAGSATPLVTWKRIWPIDGAGPASP
jgi:hypothetical protein